MTFTDWDDERLLAARESPGQAAEAFTVFYDRYERAIAAFHMRRCGSVDDAADLTAETFARALNGRRRFTADGKDAGIRWLFGIARFVGLEHQRRSGQQQSALAKLQIERPAVSTAASDSMMEFLEDSSVAQVVEGLPPRQREAVLRHVIDERSYRELSEELGVPEPVVRKRVSRGLLAARRSLKGSA